MTLPIASFIPGENMLPILAIIVLLFGAQKLPALARSMGEGIKEFKKGIREVSSDDEETKPAEKTQV
jgi:sec-independent protein translocase protein TatA